MEILFNNTLRPITSKIAFIEGDINTIIRKFLFWQTPLIAKHNNSFEKIILDNNLKNNLLSLCPLTTAESRKYLFIPTKNNWVAFFDNGHTGTDRTSPTVLGELLNARNIYASYDIETEETTFELYDKIEEKIDLKRSISTIKESGWTFYEFGIPLFFEKTENYKTRQIKKRFNIELLNEYLINMGIEAFNENFYNSKEAILLKKQGPKFQNTKELTLHEAQNFFRNVV